jgi:hypothetical protein
MRRLEELFILKQDALRTLLASTTSKISITCDMWTSANQLSFFGMTGHWIDNDYVYQERLIAFKFVEGEHDGLNLCNEMMSILAFWKYNQHKYPIRSAMARDFLAVQASSVSSERAFSAGANLVSKRRCAMSGHTIELTQFLKYSFRSDRQ